jgi:hypothetical protein
MGPTASQDVCTIWESSHGLRIKIPVPGPQIEYLTIHEKVSFCEDIQYLQLHMNKLPHQNFVRYLRPFLALFTQVLTEDYDGRYGTSGFVAMFRGPIMSAMTHKSIQQFRTEAQEFKQFIHFRTFGRLYLREFVQDIHDAAEFEYLHRIVPGQVSFLSRTGLKWPEWLERLGEWSLVYSERDEQALEADAMESKKRKIEKDEYLFKAPGYKRVKNDQQNNGARSSSSSTKNVDLKPTELKTNLMMKSGVGAEYAAMGGA